MCKKVKIVWAHGGKETLPLPAIFLCIFPCNLAFPTHTHTRAYGMARKLSISHTNAHRIAWQGEKRRKWHLRGSFGDPEPPTPFPTPPMTWWPYGVVTVAISWQRTQNMAPQPPLTWPTYSPPILYS